MAADDLSMQGAMPSAAMVFPEYFSPSTLSAWLAIFSEPHAGQWVSVWHHTIWFWKMFNNVQVQHGKYSAHDEMVNNFSNFHLSDKICFVYFRSKWIISHWKMHNYWQLCLLNTSLTARFMGPTGPRWAPCWPHKPCCQGYQWSLETGC